MRIGLFRGQQEAMQAVLRERRRRSTRRAVLAAACTGLPLGIGGFGLGLWSTASRASKPPSTDVVDPWLAKIAGGPIEQLRAQSAHVAAALEGAAHDHAAMSDVLLRAFHRLATLSAKKPEDIVLRRRLLSLARRAGMPTEVVETAELLGKE